MKYINKDRLRTEITKYESTAENAYNPSNEDADYWHGKVVACEDILDIIDSLQQEPPEQDITEFEKALNDFGDAYATLVDRDNNPNIGIHCNAYHELVQERVNEILSLAKEYVKREQPEVDLEKESLKYFIEIRVKDDETPILCDFKFKVNFATIARHFFELGLNARKEEQL